MTNATLQTIRISDDSYEIRCGTERLGWVTRWYERDALNSTGVRRFSARPADFGPARHKCESMSSAIAYLRGYAMA